jgi:tripartite-type tricarboxylate transporter receptor subunit TctC
MLPDVPTMIESGFKDYEIALWMALAAPEGTPDPIIDRMNKELSAIISEPQTRQALLHQGFEPTASDPAAVTARMKAETASWKALIGQGIVQPQ